DGAVSRSGRRSQRSTTFRGHSRVRPDGGPEPRLHGRRRAGPAQRRRGRPYRAVV
ncbi:MAG: hypothetical protein AVDCRST_MAG02-1321, partial [uncultured Rubrobacteraceae bacterium]